MENVAFSIDDELLLVLIKIGKVDVTCRRHSCPVQPSMKLEHRLTTSEVVLLDILVDRVTAHLAALSHRSMTPLDGAFLV